jgi:hypothetical protein
LRPFQADFNEAQDKITITLDEISPIIAGETKIMFFSSNKVCHNPFPNDNAKQIK